MTVEKIWNMEDPTAQYDAAMAMYDEIKDNPTGNIQQATELLMIMANNKLGKRKTVDSSVLAKLDELLETYHGQYFIIPMDESGVANRNVQNIAGSNAYRKNLPITLYDESGKEIIDYSVDKEIVMKYHCIGAFSISDSLCITEEFAYSSTANGGAGTDFTSFAVNRKSNNNEKDYEFEYDDNDRLIRMKWKVYPLKADKQGNIVVLDNQYKTAQYDFSYRDDGFLHSAVCSGYSYDYWYEGDFIDGEYVEYDGELVFEDTEDHKLELLSLEDGTCFAKGVTKAKYKKLSNEEELISLYAGSNIYYDLRKERVSKIYCCEQLGDGLEMWREFKFYYKSKGDLKDISEAKTAYIIFYLIIYLIRMSSKKL